MWPGAVSMVVLPSTADGNPEITFHTEGHLLLRWGGRGRGGHYVRERQRNYEHDTDLLLLQICQVVCDDILLFRTAGIQARILSDKCSERKNLVSALVHPGFLHHWLWFAQIPADTGQISREIFRAAAARVNIQIYLTTQREPIYIQQRERKNLLQSSLWLR